MIVQLQIKKGFEISTEIKCEDKDNNNKNDYHYNLFEAAPVNMITTQQGTKEWHICRSFLFTSLMMLEIMAILNWLNIDWPEYISVKQFYSKEASKEAAQRNAGN